MLATSSRRGWERRAELGPGRVDAKLKDAIERVIADLDAGAIRVAEKRDGAWTVNQWVKQAVLLSFRINENRVIEGGYTRYFDKVPPKYADYDAERFSRAARASCRMRSCAAARSSRRDVVLMPSFVNIGAYVDKGSMIDTWATVGSCAQIGKNVHLSGGAGIGGVLEPIQAGPTIIEDDCFIGARSEVVEGVVVERGSVLGMGVYIGQSTRIYDRETRPGALRPRAGRLGRRRGQPAVEGRQVQPLLRGDREEGRREDALEDVAQRAAAHRRLSAPHGTAGDGRRASCHENSRGLHVRYIKPCHTRVTRTRLLNERFRSIKVQSMRVYSFRLIGAVALAFATPATAQITPDPITGSTDAANPTLTSTDADDRRASGRILRRRVYEPLHDAAADRASAARIRTSLGATRRRRRPTPQANLAERIIVQTDVGRRRSSRSVASA